jgi:hypothetical protein
MSQLLSYSDAKQMLISSLTRDALLHEMRKFKELGEGYDNLDTAIPRDGGPQFAKLLLALEFWSSWLDSCEHDWFFYEPIKEPDWPILARRIADDLANDRDITDTLLLEKFAPRPQSKSVSWLRRLFAGNATKTP